MKTFLTYLRTEQKRAFRFFPGFMAGAIVLILLISTVALLAGKVLYQDKAVQKIKAGVVLPEQDDIAKKAVSMIEDMKTVSESCDFVYMSEEEGRRQLSRGDIECLMIVPESVVQNIMNGTNTPITVVLLQSAQLSSMLFREMADAGAMTLSSAQAAIYSVDEYLAFNGALDRIPAAEEQLNEIFINYALYRDTIFKPVTVSAVENLSPAVYFAVYLSIFCLLLLGIPAASYMEPLRPVTSGKLKIIGIGRWKILLSRMIIFAGMLYVILLIVLSAVSAFILKGVHGSFVAKMMFTGFFVCLAASSLIMCVYELAGHMFSGVMILFILTVIMTFVSGGFIPSVFLPAAFDKIKLLFPVHYMADAFSKIAEQGSFLPGIWKLSAWTIFSFFLSLAGRRTV